jgi:5-methylphenazine-1-carboxylate 1-monooxygenase
MVNELCGGTFDNIADVIPPDERVAFMAGYKAAAGFAIEQLNKATRHRRFQPARVPAPRGHLNISAIG